MRHGGARDEEQHDTESENQQPPIEKKITNMPNPACIAATKKLTASSA
jgi:hypothetical protein